MSYIKAMQEIIGTEISSLIATLSAGEKIADLISAIESYYSPKELSKSDMGELVEKLRKHLEVYQQLRKLCGFGSESLLTPIQVGETKNNDFSARVSSALLKQLNLIDSMAISDKLSPTELLHRLLKFLASPYFPEFCKLRVQGTVEYEDLDATINQLSALLPKEVKQAKSCSHLFAGDGVDRIIEDAITIAQRLPRYALLGDTLKKELSKLTPVSDYETLIQIAELLIVLGGSYTLLANERLCIVSEFQGASAAATAKARAETEEDQRVKKLREDGQEMDKALTLLRGKIKERETRILEKYNKQLSQMLSSGTSADNIAKIKAAMQAITKAEPEATLSGVSETVPASTSSEIESSTTKVRKIYAQLAEHIPEFKSIYDQFEKQIKLLKDKEAELSRERQSLRGKVAEVARSAMEKAKCATDAIAKSEKELRSLLEKVSGQPAVPAPKAEFLGKAYVSELKLEKTQKKEVDKPQRSRTQSLLDIVGKGRNLGKKALKTISKKLKGNGNDEDSVKITKPTSTIVAKPNAAVPVSSLAADSSVVEVEPKDTMASSSVAVKRQQYLAAVAQSAAPTEKKFVQDEDEQKIFATVGGKVAEMASQFDKMLKETISASEALSGKINKLEKMMELLDSDSSEEELSSSPRETASSRTTRSSSVSESSRFRLISSTSNNGSRENSPSLSARRDRDMPPASSSANSASTPRNG
jgi:hypothetical protein